MGRVARTIGVVLVGLGVAALAQAQPSPLVVSGQPFLAIIDGDGDGPDPAEDCRFEAFAGGAGGLTVEAFQDSNLPLRACLPGEYTGRWFTDNGSSAKILGAELTSSTIGGINRLPIQAVLSDSGSPPNGQPLVVDKLSDTVALRKGAAGAVVGGGLLCDMNGPAARVTTDNGLSFIQKLGFYPDAQSPTFLKAPNIPFPTEPGPGVAMLNAYVPVNPDKTLTLAVQGGSSPLILINLNALQACWATAPTMSGWMLFALVACLVLAAAWALGLRKRFAEALPLP